MQNNQPATLTIRKTVRLAALSVCLILLATSCGANYHLKRAIAKDPTLLQKEFVKLDTILITEQKILRDTIVTSKYDTINIIKDKVRLQIVKRVDTMFVDVECQSDTIFFTKEIAVDKIVQKKEDNTKFILAIVLAVAFALLYLSKVIRSL